MMRLRTSSTAPRKYPVMRPSVVPSTVPRMVASGAMIRMLREPTMTRAKTSRPRRSVPNRWSIDGAWSALIGFDASGSWTNSGPKIAQKTQMPMMVAPAMKVLERRRRASCSRRADCPSPAGPAVGVPTSASSNAELSGWPGRLIPRSPAGPGG